MQQNSLLATKFYIPPTRTKSVPRPDLIQRLNTGLGHSNNFARKLTLVSAPAGFGKTTLLTEWLDTQKETQVVNRIAWLSLDEGDNDPARFLTYFITALSQTEGSESTLGKSTLSMLKSPQPPATETILTSIINEIVTNSTRVILVLDDYHLIETQPIHDALTFLLEILPPQMHLVIATREDPHLSLARLRVRGQLTELRAMDLRFTSSEAAEFLNQVMGLDLTIEDIAALENRTEGWIAGLQLAALALQGTSSTQGRDDAANFIQSFTGSHRHVLDYLIEEVLDQQPENIQTFLLQTAVLNRLTGSLCDAVTGQENRKTILEYLEHSNLFIIPLDEVRQWYRYHHLFADLLHHRLRETHRGQIPTLHQRASQWYERNGLPSDAIHHALAAEDFERVADLAELAWPAWSGSFQSITWLGWVKTLPEELVRSRPVLCIAYAWAFLNAGKLEDAESRLLDVERWLESKSETSEQLEEPPVKMVVVDEEQFRLLPASLATARAYHAQAIGDVSSTVKYARRVLDLLPGGYHKWRGDATALLGLASWASGDLETAHKTFSDGLTGMSKPDIIIGTFVLADIKMTLGHLHEAVRSCEHGLRLAAEVDEPLPIGTEDIYSGLGELHREQGDLETASYDLATSRKLGEQVELPDWQYRWCIAQARVQETLGQLDDALNLLDEAERLYVRTPLPVVRPIAAMKARVWVRQGRLTEALGWVSEQGLSADDHLSYLREFEHITLVRVLIARYKCNPMDDSIHQAMDLVDRLLHSAEKGRRIGSAIEILVLQSLAHEAQGNINSALESLEHALTLAEPEDYFRIFVDEGPSMARLLFKARARGITPEYVQRLLAAFPIPEPEQPKPSKPQKPVFEWVEPLSEREIEVLGLIAEGLTNQEIATRLYLALNTVKVHTRNINSKLDVSSRTKAVVKARALGVLPPT